MRIRKYIQSIYFALKGKIYAYTILYLYLSFFLLKERQRYIHDIQIRIRVPNPFQGVGYAYIYSRIYIRARKINSPLRIVECSPPLNKGIGVETTYDILVRINFPSTCTLKPSALGVSTLKNKEGNELSNPTSPNPRKER